MFWGMRTFRRVRQTANTFAAVIAAAEREADYYAMMSDSENCKKIFLLSWLILTLLHRLRDSACLDGVEAGLAGLSQSSQV